jgi:Saxitoxin biosynthesis operon protein SxtJ
MRDLATAHERLVDDDEVIESSPRAFGFLFAVVFTVVGVLPLWRQAPLRLWSLAVAAVFLVAALVIPSALGPLSRLWQRVGLVLHYVVNPLVMGALFYLAITPFGLVMRLFGRGLSVHLAPDARLSTYWRSRSESPPAGMRNQF